MIRNAIAIGMLSVSIMPGAAGAGHPVFPTNPKQQTEKSVTGNQRSQETP